VTVGETVTGEATVEYTGDSDAVEVRVRMVADGEPVAAETVTVRAGETRDVSVEITLDSPGEYDVEIVGGTSRTVVVTELGSTTVEASGASLASLAGARLVYLLLPAVAAAALISGIRILRE
jgi:hypothetical protein